MVWIFFLIFWLNCNILTCCPTLFFFSVLYSCPQCWISSLPILQHPLLQTFTPPTSSPQARKISLQSSTSHMAIPSGFPYNLSSSSFLLSAVSLAVSHSLYLCFLACQLGLFKAMSVLTCWPAAPLACQAWQTIPCSAAGPAKGSERVGLREAPVGTLSVRVEQSYGISVWYQMGAAQTFHLKRMLLGLKDLFLVAAKSWLLIQRQFWNTNT